MSADQLPLTGFFKSEVDAYAAAHNIPALEASFELIWQEFSSLPDQASRTAVFYALISQMAKKGDITRTQATEIIDASREVLNYPS